MEIRSATISYTEGKCRQLNSHELEIKELLDKLDEGICNSDDLQNIDQELKQYDDLKKRSFKHYTNKKGIRNLQCLDLNVAG